MENIHIQQWDEATFYNAREQWNDLLARSSADPLFLSWEWQSNWWRYFSDSKDMELRLYTASTEDGKLLGIAPLFSTRVSIKNIFNIKRLQFIGNCWRGKATMPTELMDFITDKTTSKDVKRAFADHINTLVDWHELIIPFLDTESETYKLISQERLFPQCYLRQAEKFNSYYLRIAGCFQDYTQNLGKNTRLKLLNRRKNLEKIGKINYKKMPADNIDIEGLFDLLNELHKKRWGKAIFKNRRLEFNVAVAKLMAEKNNLNFSVITLDDKPVSIQYNYVINKHNYNIQAGFNENLHNKISLGYLHFGYEIEDCFANKNSIYDFLAGEGKNTQYKERLTGDHLQVIDLQIVRNPLLKLLYKLYGLIRQ